MGVTIPDTQDYGTPVPRASTGVQSYGVAQPVQQDVAAWTYAANSAKAAADSDAAVMKETAAAVEKWSVSLDTTAAQDALNQLRGQRQELTSGESGFMRVEGGKVQEKGKDGLTMFESYPQKLQSGMEAIGSKLSSPRAQKMFREAAAAELLGYKSDVSRHGLKQTEVYQGAVYKDTQEILANRVAASNDPAEIDMLLKKIEQAALDRANVLGVPGEAAATAARSDGAMLVIQKAINTGDSKVAMDALTRYGGNLDAKDRIKVDGLVKTLSTDDRSRSQAQSFYDTSYDGRTRGYEGGKMEFNKLGSGAFGPYQFMPETWAEVRAKNPGLNLPADMTMPGATDEERRRAHDAAHNAFKAANAASLKADGLEATPANLYLAHRFGAKGAASVLKANADAPLSSVLPAEWQAQNPDMKGQTAGSFRALAERRYAGVTDTGVKVDPLQAGVDRTTGVTPAAPAGKDGPDYKDPDVLLYQANERHKVATLTNQEENATNSDGRANTQKYLDLMLANEKKQIDQMRLLQKNQLNEVMKTSPTDPKQIKPELWNQLSFRERESVTNIIKHNAKGTEAVTDQQHWYEIQRGLSSEDPAERQKWAEYDLWKSKDKLDSKDLQELAKMQGTVRKGDPDKQTTHVRNINQMVDDTLLKIGVDSTPKAGSGDATKALKFRRFVQDQITALEAAQPGKKATTEQQQKIIDRAAIDVVTKKGFLWDSTKPGYEVTIKDVPDAEKAKITDALKRQGYTPTDDMIVELFARKNAKQAK